VEVSGNAILIIWMYLVDRLDESRPNERSGHPGPALHDNEMTISYQLLIGMLKFSAR